MSVFKAREWWGTQCADSGEEELGAGCMALGNLDNAPGGTAKLVNINLAATLVVIAKQNP